MIKILRFILLVSTTRRREFRKKSRGILPIISMMPKDNHSLMQLYLDGPKNNFFTFFRVEEKVSNKIHKKHLTNSYSYLSKKILTIF